MHKGAALRECMELPPQILLLCLGVFPIYLFPVSTFGIVNEPPPLERAGEAFFFDADTRLTTLGLNLTEKGGHAHQLS